MRKYTFFIYAVAMLFMVACNSRKSSGDVIQSDMENISETDSLRLDTLHRPSPEDFEEGHMPPPPPDGRGFDGPPPPPPHGKAHHPHHEPDNMRGFDPASEDDMDDNGMSRYMENNDEEGWD